MCDPGTAMIIASVIGGATTLASTAMAPKPKMPSTPPKSKVPQELKKADKDTANMVKTAKLRSGPSTPNTLLTGSMGVADEELNLQTTRLV